MKLFILDSSFQLLKNDNLFGKPDQLNHVIVGELISFYLAPFPSPKYNFTKPTLNNFAIACQVIYAHMLWLVQDEKV